MRRRCASGPRRCRRCTRTCTSRRGRAGVATSSAICSTTTRATSRAFRTCPKTAQQPRRHAIVGSTPDASPRATPFVSSANGCARCGRSGSKLDELATTPACRRSRSPREQRRPNNRTPSTTSRRSTRHPLRRQRLAGVRVRLRTRTRKSSRCWAPKPQLKTGRRTGGAGNAAAPRSSGNRRSTPICGCDATRTPSSSFDPSAR